MRTILNWLLILSLITPVNALAAISEPDRAMIPAREILKNNGFENGKVGWTASGGTFTVDAASKHSGNLGASWDSSAASQTLKSDYVALSSANNNLGFKGQNGVAYCKLQSVTTVGTYTIKAVNGDGLDLATAITPSASTANFQTVLISNFIYPNSGNSTTDRVAIWLTSVAANEPAIRIDDCSFRLADNIGTVNQAVLIGTVKVTACSGTWTRANSAFGNLSTQTSCSYAVTGSLTAPSTMVAGFQHPDLGAGTYVVEYEGGLLNGATSNVAHFRFNDGTNSSLEDTAVYSSSSATVISPNMKHTFTYTSPKAAGTIQMQAKHDSSATVEVYGTNVTSGTFRMWYFPNQSQQIYNANVNNWHVDANISGANPSLGTSNQSSYIGIEDASLTLTNNTGYNVLAAQIPCSSTNSPSGTTCSSGSESVGVSFVLPVASDVLACASFARNFLGTGVANSVFQLVETPNNAQTISQEGKTRLTIHDQNTGADNRTFGGRVCGNFTFTSSGQKTIRLMYEQSTSATVTTNTIVADASASLGQRDIHWEVYPVNLTAVAPISIGSVTSNKNNRRLDVIVFCYGGSATCSGNCTTGTCNTSSMSDSLTSMTFNSTGNYTANFNKTYSKLMCNTNSTCSGSSNAIADNFYCTSGSCTTATITTANGSNTPCNSIGNITCYGEL